MPLSTRPGRHSLCRAVRYARLFHRNEYDLTVLFPVHFIREGSILPVNILLILRKEVYL